MDFHTALLDGPWVIFGHNLIVQPWDPSFSTLSFDVKKIFAWLRLPGLPYQYYHKSLVRAIGELLGEVIRIDYNTESRGQIRSNGDDY